MSLPTPPLRSDGPTTFADRGDTFMAALPAFEIEMNALGAQVALDAAAVIAVAPGAVAAANFKGEYGAGTTYQVGQSVSYAGDTWFAKTVNTGVTPVTGAAWQRVVAIPSQTGNSGKVLTTDGSDPSWIPLAVVGDHRISVHSGNGHGSTNNRIRRYTTAKVSVGSAIVYADSATLGATFTIQAGFGGLYAIGMQDWLASNSATFGVSRNSNQLTSHIDFVSSTNKIQTTIAAGAQVLASIFAVVRLIDGDVIRPHTDGSCNGSTEVQSNFSITRVGL